MPDPKTVFIVHGRNLRIRAAMAQFLRAVQLRPFEWEQAVALTGDGTPDTLDVVRAGIEHAQCVVVLLTGDDLAKLQSAHGEEEAQPQPRPNVLFEAGWALAAAGQKRTVLARTGSLRGISDIDGLNLLTLGNDGRARNVLLERLRRAGCEIPDDVGADYLDPAHSGDFDEGTAEPTEEAPLLDRGRFTQVIADSAIYLDASTIDDLTQLELALPRAGRIDLKYHYMGARCARHWIDLCRHPDYGHDRLTQTVDGSFEEIVIRILEDRGGEEAPLDLISLGPGNGTVDSRLLFRMDRSGAKLAYYYCIDVSFDLLQAAMATICREDFLPKELRIKAIHGDFTRLSRLRPIYSFDPAVNLFAMVGYTLGNFEEKQLLAALYEGMDPGDYLFVDARLHELDEWDGSRALTDGERTRILKGYSHAPNDRFAFGPVEIATTCDRADVGFDHRVERSFTDVPGAVNVVTFCEGLEGHVRSSGERFQRDQLDLAATTLYRFEDLKAWLPTRQFSVLWSRKENDTGLFLLRRD